MNGLVPTTRTDSPTREGSPAPVSIDSPRVNAAAAPVVDSRATARTMRLYSTGT